VFGLEDDMLGVDGGQVGVFKEGDKVGFGG